MSVTIRPYRRGGWEVDIRVVTPDGTREFRERKRAPVSSRSAAARWAEGRERVLFERLMKPPQDNAPPKEVPTLREFVSRFLDGHPRANRQKPSGIAAKEMILRVHLVPALGHKRLDAIKSEDVQHLKGRLSTKAAKTVNNILTVLNVLLKKAVDWDVIDRMPCAVTLLPVPKTSMSFYDFDEYERLVAATSSVDATAHLIVLLGGEAGLRCGEMIALEWRDVDLGKRQICVQRSDWNGQVTTPKGGRLRYVPLTDPTRGRVPRSSASAESQRAVPGRRPAADPADGAVPRAARITSSEAVAGRRTHPASHVLFAPGDARRTAESDSGARRTSGTGHDAALHAPESSGARQRDSAAGSAVFRTEFWRHFGDGEGLRRKDQWLEQLNWR